MPPDEPETVIIHRTKKRNPMAPPTYPGYDQKIVKLTEFAVSGETRAVLSTQALGSCLGITFYDPEIKIGGVLHAMLPYSAINPKKAAERPGMFVDTGVRALLKALQQAGANRANLKVCAAGAAQIINTAGYFKIGLSNYEAFQSVLAAEGLSIHAREIGGLTNRNIHLMVGTGEVRLSISGRPNDIVLCKS